MGARRSQGAAAATGQSGRGNNWAHGYRQPGELGGGGACGEEDGLCLQTAVRPPLCEPPSYLAVLKPTPVQYNTLIYIYI
eukprot:3501720-Pyramimonas_sp.AAC.1